MGLGAASIMFGLYELWTLANPKTYTIINKSPIEIGQFKLLWILPLSGWSAIFLHFVNQYEFQRDIYFSNEIGTLVTSISVETLSILCDGVEYVLLLFTLSIFNNVVGLLAIKNNTT